MFNIYLVVDLVVAVSLIGLAIVVLTRNKTLETNRAFALFSVFVSVWIIANYISNNTSYSSQVAVAANYFVFTCSYAAVYCLIWFTIALSKDQMARKWLKRFTPLLIVVGALGATPLVVAGVHEQGNVYAVNFGPLAPIYFGTLLILIVCSVYLIRRNQKRSTGLTRDRLSVLFVSWVLTLPIVLLANFILPTATGWFGLSNIGTIPMVITVYGLYYSVVKHKLFDLRLIIVRSLAYLVTITFLSVFYAVATYYITSIVSKTNNRIISIGLNVLVIVSVVYAYAPLRKLFNRWTNKYFYQDAYEPQELFDNLNRVLVTTLDINKLLSQVSNLIVNTLNVESCLFSLKGSHYSSKRLISSQKIGLTSQAADVLSTDLYAFRHTVFSADYIEDEENKLAEKLRQSGLSTIVKLEDSSHKGSSGVGYMALGPKKSGNPYSEQDLRVLDTISKELLIAIQNAQHFEEIQNFNLTLQGKVDDATKKLRKANERLKELDESKDDFISMASHQLRTPLTSIKGYISMVLEGDAGKVSPMEREMLGQAFFSSQRMVYLIADLLNVSRLKTGKFVIEKSRINLAKMVAQELDQLKETAESRQLKLTYDQPEHFPDLWLDETKTRQVIMNFVDNAIYYTPANGHVHVRLVDNPTTVELRVEDDGIGVAKSDQPHLFTKFYRAGNARKARPDGTGLGLFMAKKVIIAEEGTLIFESEEGKGSTFGFIISKAKADPDKAAVTASQDKDSAKT